MEFNLFKFDSWNLMLPWRKRQKPAVLIVEDNPNDSLLLCAAAEAEGFHTELATSAEIALGVLHRNGRNYIAAFVDVGLPHMDGWKLALEINRHWPTLTVCIMSGASERLMPPQPGRMYDVLWKSESYFDVFRQLKSWKNL